MRFGPQLLNLKLRTVRTPTMHKKWTKQPDFPAGFRLETFRRPGSLKCHKGLSSADRVPSPAVKVMALLTMSVCVSVLVPGKNSLTHKHNHTLTHTNSHRRAALIPTGTPACNSIYLQKSQEMPKNAAFLLVIQTFLIPAILKEDHWMTEGDVSNI